MPNKSSNPRKKTGIKLNKPRSELQTGKNEFHFSADQTEILSYLQKIQECNQRYQELLERYLQGINELKTVLESFKPHN